VRSGEITRVATDRHLLDPLPELNEIVGPALMITLAFPAFPPTAPDSSPSGWPGHARERYLR
jgi:hypothetical protein